MKRKFAVPTAILFAAALFGNATAAASGDLVVSASGFGHSDGQAIAKLFAPGDNVLAKGRWEVSAPIADGRAALVFSNVQPGSYSLVVFHDVNGNGVIDHNSLGFPAEPLGFSNNFSLGLTSGLPTFEKLRFEHGAANQRLEIRLR